MRALAAMLASSVLILCACGGGGDSGDSSGSANPPLAPSEPPPPSEPVPPPSEPVPPPSEPPAPSEPVTLSGVVAAESALAAYAIEVIAPPAAQGSSVKTFPARAGADGRYTAALGSDAQPPFLVRAARSVQEAHPQYLRLMSVTKHGGTVNVTPLTSLLVARLLNRKLALFVGAADGPAVAELQHRSDAEIAAAQRQVLTYLLNRPSRDNGNVVSPVDVSAVTDFVSMPLVAAPGDPHFEALRRLHASLMDSETITGVEEHMLFGNDPPADLRSMFAFDFLANCSSVGTLPQGTVRIIVDRRGTMFGDFNVPHGSHLIIHVDPGGIHTWEVKGRELRDVQVSAADGRVTSIRFLDVAEVRPQTLIRCVPLGEVSVAGKHPSAMAIIRMLARSIRDSVFQCEAPVTFPGFVQGANRLAIEQNGALRINGPGGPSLHLPSMNFSIVAALSMAADGIAPTPFIYSFAQVFGPPPESGFRSRTFGVRVGDDGVRLVDDGRITGLSFGSSEAGPDQARRDQRCGLPVSLQVPVIALNQLVR